MAEQTILYRVKVITDGNPTEALSSIETQIAANNKARAELNKKIKEGTDLTAKERQSLIELTAQQKNLAQQKREYLSQIEKEVKVSRTNEESLEGMRARISQMRAEYEKLAPASEAGKKLAASIADIQKQINEADFATKNFRGNVGNYMEAANAAVEGTVKSFGDLKRELRELKNTSLQGKTTEEIQAINARIGEIGESLDDMRAQAKGAAVGMAESFAGTAAVISGTVQGVAGFTDVLGIQGEILGEVQQKMTSLVAVTQALFVIEDALGKKTVVNTALKIKDVAITTYNTVAKTNNAIATAAQTKAEAAHAVVTGSASLAAKAAAAATWLWNAAIAASPIGWIAAAVVGLTAGVIALVGAMDDGESQTDKLNKQLALFNQEVKRTKDAQSFMLEYAKAIGLSTQELRKLEQANIAVNRANAWRELNLLIKLGSDRTAEQTTRMNELKNEIGKLKEQELLMSATARRESWEARQKEANDMASKAREEAKVQAEKNKKIQEDKIKIQQEGYNISQQLAYDKEQELAEFIASTNEANNEQLVTEIDDSTYTAWETAFNKKAALAKQEVDYFATVDKDRFTQQEYALKESFYNREMSEAEYLDKTRRLNEERNQAMIDGTFNTVKDIASLFGEGSKQYKQVATAQAVIQAIQAAQAAYVRGMEIPFVGFVLAPIMAAAALAAGMANVRKINEAKDKFSEGGVIQGNSHADGGVPFTVNGQGGFEAEGGEVIINKRSAKMFLPELSRINEAGGGRRLYARGGMITQQADTQQAQISTMNDNILSAIERIQQIPVVVSAKDITTGVRKVEVISKAGDL